jgi:phospholipid/cholesterol/gamma-HCH transport system substrate-binding protein
VSRGKKKETMSRRTEIQVGITVLAALFLLLWGVTWLKEFSLESKHRLWLVHFPETGGLSASDEVQVDGIRKGAVSDVTLTGDGVLIRLALSSEITLTRDCRVAIRNVGMMGERVIAVDLRTTGQPYTDRDTIPGIFELGLPEVVAKLAPAVSTVGDLTRELQGVAEALNKNGDFAGTMRNLKSASEDLRRAVRENRRALQATVDNFQAASKTARSLTTDRESQLRTAIDHFASTAEKLDRLSGRLDSLRATLQSVGSKMDRGQGTLGKLVNDDKVYDDTRAAVAELKALLADIKANPKKYLTVRIF